MAILGRIIGNLSPKPYNESVGFAQTKGSEYERHDYDYDDHDRPDPHLLG